MDLYHIWADVKPGTGDLEFAEAVNAYLGHLQTEGLIKEWRLTRRKLGLGPEGLGEWHIIIETMDMAQLEQAFKAAAARTGEVEKRHSAVYSKIAQVKFGLTRDFPDAVRKG